MVKIILIEIITIIFVWTENQLDMIFADQLLKSLDGLIEIGKYTVKFVAFEILYT